MDRHPSGVLDRHPSGRQKFLLIRYLEVRIGEILTSHPISRLSIPGTLVGPRVRLRGSHRHGVKVNR